MKIEIIRGITPVAKKLIPSIKNTLGTTDFGMIPTNACFGRSGL